MKYELHDEKVFEDDDCVGERGSLFHSCTKKIFEDYINFRIH